jgi:DNA-binding NarL/FixJ family response regulator
MSLTALAETVADPTLRAQVLAALPSASQPPSARRARRTLAEGPGGLTGREREIAGLVARGLSNRTIADTLVIGERTVETHISNILAKLEFSTRTEIAAWVVAQGLTATSN